MVGKITEYEEFTGHTEAVRSIVVQAMVTGYLDKVLFKEGEVVVKDAPLFKIDPRIFQSQLDRPRRIWRWPGPSQTAGGRPATCQVAIALQRDRPGRLRQGGRRSERGRGDRRAAAAAQKLAQQNLNFTTITASIGGRVSRQMIDPGNMVKANDTPLTPICFLDKMYIYFDVDERTTIHIRRLIDEGKITSAERATLTINYGLADETGFPHAADVNFVDNSIDSSTGTWRLRAVIEKPDALLLPNMFLRVRVPIGKPYDALLVPERALGSDQGQKYLYVLDKENKAVYKQVQCGAAPRRQGGHSIRPEGGRPLRNRRSSADSPRRRGCSRGERARGEGDGRHAAGRCGRPRDGHSPRDGQGG